MKKRIAILVIVVLIAIFAMAQFLKPSTEVTIYVIDLTSADTEYSQALPIGTKYFDIQAKPASDIRFAFESGDTADGQEWFPIEAGSEFYSPSGIHFVGKTIYLRDKTTAGTDVHIIAWHE